jgi:transposase
VEPPAPVKPSYEEVVAANDRLRQRLVELEARLEAALAEIERLKRSGKRQATPFSTGKRTAQPKKPGRKPGEGPFRRREAPAPENVTHEVPVPLPDEPCPDCGGSVLRDGRETVTVTDLPPVVRLEVTAYHLETGHCQDCGAGVRGTHPDLPRDQRGATAHRLGPRLLALAHWLHYGIGVPVRKVPAVLATVYGAVVTQSALTQDALRRAQGRVGEAYQTLRKQIAQEPVVCTDDTGWKVGGAVAFLMGFFSVLTSVFQIRPRHRNDEVREVIPETYAGTLSTDRGRSYDARKLEQVRQQKCLSHIDRSLSEALAGRVPGEQLIGRGRSFCLRLKRLLREAMALWEAYHAEQAPDFETERQRIREAVTEHLRERKIRGEANRRLLSELGWHHRQGNLLRFLEDPRIEPTNNRAERGLRPAVIARKVSHCSKSWDGAHAHAAFMSLFCTLRQRGARSIVGAMADVFQTGRLPGPA